MKYLVLALAAGVLALTACNKEDGTGGAAPAAGSVDSAKVETAFASADATTKSSLEAAVASAKAGNYSDALTKLQALAANVKLTPEQQQAVKDFIAQLQSKAGGALKDAAAGASDATKSATDAANKTGADLQKTLTK